MTICSSVGRHDYFQNSPRLGGNDMRNPGPDAREMPPLTMWGRLRRDILTWPRRVTADKRVLPNMILLGAQRAGTTSIHSHLGKHPGVYLSKTKEIHYFDNYQEQGLDCTVPTSPLGVGPRVVPVSSGTRR